ncbi:MAG: acetate--CoA ligase family protein [Alphaproteobacteria bacterium]|nr:acetate--CoA ligase family protein [Alphaproteobacteria bacterium]
MNLDSLFSPTSLALIGASPKEGSLGRALLENIIKGGYKGTIFLINPKYTQVLDLPCSPSIETLPFPPDIAVLCTPAKSVPTIIEDLGKKGTKFAVVITAGFSEENGEEGRILQEAMIENAKIYGIRIVGPNCLGIMNPSANFNATFSPRTPHKGNIAFVSQSGAILVSLLEWAHVMGVGFSKLISVGGLSDLNFADYLKYLMHDSQTKSIILYIETLTDAHRFLSIAREAIVKKPVIVIKSGRFQEVAQAVRSHSGALAGSDAVYEAAFRQAGLFRVYELQDIYDLLLTLNHLPQLKGDQLAILTNGGGVGILATDTLISIGGELAILSSSTLNKLNVVLPPTWSHGNPIDIIGDASPERYTKALEILMDDPKIQTILLIHCPTALSPAKEVFEAIIETLTKKQSPRPDIFLVSLQQNIEKKMLSNFFHEKVPIYPTPERAVRAFMHLVKCEAEKDNIEKKSRKTLKVEPNVSRILKDLVKKKDQEWLDHHIVQEILTLYDIPVVKTAFASSPAEASVLSQKMDFPLVLKIASKDIVHKSEVGGVALNLNSPEEVEKSAHTMLTTVSHYFPQARNEGFILQPMIPLNHGFELFLGGIRDETFGPVVIFGAGGKAVEVIKDKALALAPLTKTSALNLIKRTRIYEQLKGYRDQKPIPFDQLLDCLIHLSYLLVNQPEIAELDINPLLVDTKKILVLDARTRIFLK